MICLIAGNYNEAKQYARGQLLDPDEWFYPIDINDLNRYQNFHVLVVGTAGMNVPSSYFNKVFELAKARGRINRRW